MNTAKPLNLVHKIDRRHALQSLFGSWVAANTDLVSAYDETAREPFGFRAVQMLAQQLAQRPFQPSPPLPEPLRRLDYDQHRLIAFRHERALWREQRLPFWVEFHHRGFLAADHVDVFLVEDGREHRFPFDPDLFQYRGEMAELRPATDWGYAGFRLLCRLPTRPQHQEFCTFLGASYFRAVCTDQVYGISARGLAINTGMSRPEEFPRFRTFWIERPALDARAVRLWALLDGPSVTGAYEFLITPGQHQTTLDVHCQLYFRSAVEKLCIAPMSSMWIWGEGDQPAADPRPEVHDSDGLLAAGDHGEWLWRPLARRGQVSVSQFRSESLRGFGLLQRDRDADHYRDDEAKYHLRPSLWIRPREPWEPGTVELLELPSQREIEDNIAAYWVPRQPASAGDTRTLRYQVAIAAGDPGEHRGGRFVRTQVRRLPGGDRHFELEVDSAALRSLSSTATLEPVVTADRGRVVEPACTRLPGGAWRLSFLLTRPDERPAELRAYVRLGGDILSETWSYLCT